MHLTKLKASRNNCDRDRKNANSLFVMYSNCLCVRNKKKKEKRNHNGDGNSDGDGDVTQKCMAPIPPRSIHQILANSVSAVEF